MSKKNNEFFKVKNPWSLVKDELLGCYFKPYLSKILHTHKPLIYVDCFARKGRFDDGADGSPVIASKIISECLSSTKADKPNVNAFFIELNHGKDLTENLSSYMSTNIICGKFEEQIENILIDKLKCNIFLYIDPYGIKALDFDIFKKLSSVAFPSFELLINFNTFGFIREACHALGKSFDDNNIFDDLIEYDKTIMDKSSKSIDDLSQIADGDYRKEIIRDFKILKHYEI